MLFLFCAKFCLKLLTWLWEHGAGPHGGNKSRVSGGSKSQHHNGLDTLVGLELELVSNSSSSPKLTLAPEVF
jgi:hypothetical protein